jgi:hypothetical protein
VCNILRMCGFFFSLFSGINVNIMKRQSVV